MLHIQRTDRDLTYCGRAVPTWDVLKARPSDDTDRPDYCRVQSRIAFTERVCKTCWKAFRADCGMS